MIKKDCDNSKFSSNINEVIKAVLNFFLRKDFAHTKSTKSTKSIKGTKQHKDTWAKARNANKQISDYFPLRCFRDIFYFCLLVCVLCFFVVVKFLNKGV